MRRGGVGQRPAPRLQTKAESPLAVRNEEASETVTERKKGQSGRKSQVVTHPQFATIELAVANDVSLKALAEQYGVSRDALSRFKRSMTPERKALLRYRVGESPIDLERLKRGEAELVTQRNVVMLAELQQLYRLCIIAKDFKTAVRVAGEYREYNELQARFVGELVTGDQHLHVQFQESPLYRELLALIMAWAAKHPDLAAELSGFVEAHEQKRRQMEAMAAARVIEHKPNGYDHGAPHP